MQARMLTATEWHASDVDVDDDVTPELYLYQDVAVGDTYRRRGVK